MHGRAFHAEGAGTRVDGKSHLGTAALRLRAGGTQVGEDGAHGVAVLRGLLQAVEGDGHQARDQGDQAEHHQQLNERKAGGTPRPSDCCGIHSCLRLLVLGFKPDGQ